MTYAIIQLAGKQFKVAAGDTIVTDRLDVEADKELTVSDVLFIGNTEKAADAVIGAPTISGASVVLKATSHGKGEKIRVFKYKSKSRYRKIRGHRQFQTTLEVMSIKTK